jgi:2-succinyl-6-hydroxy-2,4-cyclohexadiene-1-carboxylate synthase
VSSEATSRAATATTLATATRGEGPAVTIVHGFAQTGACLGPLADAVAADHTVVLPDAAGHGASTRHAAADLRRGAELLAASGPSGPVIGYSMGGRLALRTALDHPAHVTALVLIGATAGIESDAERSDRRQRDHELADRVEQIGVEAFVEEWLALPLFAGLPRWARFDDERRSNTAAGLAGSLRAAGTGSMEPLWDRLAGLAIPLLCVTGGSDVRFGELAARIVDAVGGPARHVVVAGAGHAAHLEQPGAVSDAVLQFLGDLAAGGPGGSGRDEEPDRE